MSKIVEKKNESKSQRCIVWKTNARSCVKDRWEKEWKQITTSCIRVNAVIGLCQRSLRKRMKANHNCTLVSLWHWLLCQRSLRKRMKANHNKLETLMVLRSVVSKIVEKKNESKSQHKFAATVNVLRCVKDRWEKEWKQITTISGKYSLIFLLCQRSLRKRMKANHNLPGITLWIGTGCVKDRWEKEWKQITTLVTLTRML